MPAKPGQSKFGAVNSRMRDINAKNTDYNRHAKPAQGMMRNAALGKTANHPWLKFAPKAAQDKAAAHFQKAGYDPSGPSMDQYKGRRKQALDIKRSQTDGYAKRNPNRAPVIAGADSFRTALENNPEFKQQFGQALEAKQQPGRVPMNLELPPVDPNYTPRTQLPEQQAGQLQPLDHNKQADPAQVEAMQSAMQQAAGQRPQPPSIRPQSFGPQPLHAQQMGQRGAMMGYQGQTPQRGIKAGLGGVPQPKQGRNPGKKGGASPLSRFY